MIYFVGGKSRRTAKAKAQRAKRAAHRGWGEGSQNRRQFDKKKQEAAIQRPQEQQGMGASHGRCDPKRASGGGSDPLLIFAAEASVAKTFRGR